MAAHRTEIYADELQQGCAFEIQRLSRNTFGKWWLLLAGKKRNFGAATTDQSAADVGLHL